MPFQRLHIGLLQEFKASSSHLFSMRYTQRSSLFSQKQVFGCRYLHDTYKLQSNLKSLNDINNQKDIDQHFQNQVGIFKKNVETSFESETARKIIKNTDFSKLNSDSGRDLFMRLQRADKDEKRWTAFNYSAAFIVFVVGCSWMAVPLYRLLCTETGLDGTPIKGIGDKFDRTIMVPMTEVNPIKIKFASSVNPGMNWSFVPETAEINVVPGETTLAFYKAKNLSNKDIIGFSTYSVDPMKSAQYFNKIQCFCFEEQKLNAKEEVDMPVFFFIDPEFANDPLMKDVKTITLHYTFFKSKIQ